MRIAVVGSRQWIDGQRMFDVVFANPPPQTTIISGGAEGADALAKFYALRYGLKYVEYPPKHTPWNRHCPESKKNYSKTYHVQNFFERNTEIAEACDIVYGFVPTDVTSNGTLDTCRKAYKLGKKVFIVSETNIQEYKK